MKPAYRKTAGSTSRPFPHAVTRRRTRRLCRRNADLWQSAVTRDRRGRRGDKGQRRAGAGDWQSWSRFAGLSPILS
jgi:hypothetical protein